MTPPVTLVIDRRPPVSPNTLNGGKRREKWQHDRTYRTEAFAAWCNAGRPAYERPRVVVRCYARGDRKVRDRDNQYAAVTPLLNGLKTHAFPDDDTDTIDLCVEWHVDNRWEHIEIDLEERP
jgi:hypothetical protein